MKGDIHPRKQKNRNVGRAEFISSCAVYVLECKPIPEKHIQEYAKSRIDGVPSWATEAARYPHVYYVGSTSNLFQRVGNHMHYGASEFTRLFRPKGVAAVKLYDDMELAKDKERETVLTWRTTEKRYCYSDLQRHGNGA